MQVGPDSPPHEDARRLTVDVIVAARNVGSYIYQCLASCSGPDDGLRLKVRIVDDGSSDNTAQEIASFQRDHPECEVETQSAPGIGPGPARNLALSGSSSDFVCFVDGDDLISRQALSITLRQMEALRADFACPRVTAFDDLGRYDFQHDRPDLRAEITGGRAVFVTTALDSPMVLDLETSLCMRVFRREFLIANGIRFDDLRFCEDVAPSRLAFLVARRILLTDEPYYFYRINRPGQRTSQLAESTLDVVVAVRGAVSAGIAHIVDFQQGAWLTNRICTMAFWAVELLPPGLLPAYLDDLIVELERIPAGWWSAMRKKQTIGPRAKHLAAIMIKRPSRRQLERAILSAPRPAPGYLARRVLGRIRRLLP